MYELGNVSPDEDLRVLYDTLLTKFVNIRAGLNHDVLRDAEEQVLYNHARYLLSKILESLTVTRHLTILLEQCFEQREEKS